MSRSARVISSLVVCLGSLALMQGHAQNFGALLKQKVTLQRKLPAVVHLPGPTLSVKVTGHPDQIDVANDLQAQLETELIKDNSNLTVDDTHPANTVACQITNFSHPPPSITIKQSMAPSKSAFGLPLGKNQQPKNDKFTRITGGLTVSFQAKGANGQTLISDNVNVNYDQEFDSSGSSTSQGMMGSVTSKITRVKGGDSEEMNPPTDAELRALMMHDAVKQIAAHLVDTNETLEVYLARGKGPLDDGDKQAETGLWQRALETFETAPPAPKPEDDSYRLYNVGVAYEALAYQAEDAKSAMKFLDQAAINYGKAVDAKPSEKYFLDPQKRIETAIAHYKQEEEVHARLDAEAAAAKAKPTPVSANASAPATKPSAPKALTNAQVIAMGKSGLDDDTIVQTIKAAKVTDFNLTAASRQELATNGVSPQVIAAMQARAPKKTTPAK